MRIIKAKDYDEMSRKAALLISAQLAWKPRSVLGLATGSSPLGIYKLLIDWNKDGDIDFSEVFSVNLDEYRGLGRDNDQSYFYFMKHHLFDHININPDNVEIPDGKTTDSETECARYDAIIDAKGGVDLQLLGIGHNGHIGFNEPAAYFPKGTHCVDLAESTIRANRRFFKREEDVPRQAYTMGIKTIMKAKRVILIASGEEKAEIIKAAFLGEITPQVPASILQLHPDLVLVLDNAALSKLDI